MHKQHENNDCNITGNGNEANEEFYSMKLHTFA